MSVSLVTGASGGIGRAVCLKLLQNELSVIAHYNSADEKFTDYFAGHSSRVFAVKADLKEKGDIENLFKQIENRYGHIDNVINAAGVSADELLVRYPERLWDEVIDVNLSGCFRVIKSMLPLVARGGHIINISSRSGVTGTPGQCAYSASKAALLGLTYSLAKELAPNNIRVNAVMPGYIETSMGLANLKALERAKSSSVLNTLSDAEEAADLIFFIINTKTVTGQLFTLDSRL
ncbi:MAG: SDR family NAD(P)-dependent oxidoreductase [Nitrospirae bacterium]|nr:SDR family NAD(P)-dependent oxidoreductase [Nitrospirota bacterium]